MRDRQTWRLSTITRNREDVADSMQGAGLQRIVSRNSYHVGGRTIVAQPDMATFLADYRVSEAGEHVNQPVAGHPARQPHAASNGINSSFT